jgi:hypothetical protein
VRCHCSEYRRTGYWNMYSMVRLTIWQMMVKKIVMVKCHHRCAEITVCARKRWVALKWLFLTIVRSKSGKKWGEVRVEECTRCESATLLVSQSRRFVRRRSRRYTRRWALFENECSFSWGEMNIIWNDEWVLIPDVRCRTGYWSTVVILLCTRATVIRDRDRCKIFIGRYWMSNSRQYLLVYCYVH